MNQKDRSRVFVSGGCKNGKSTFAQDLACKMHQKGESLYYLATMIPSGKEDDARIKRHQAEREGMGFTTIEAGRDILSAAVDCSGTLLLDSTTALLANEMFVYGEVRYFAYKKVAEDILQLLDRFSSTVIVSDYIYSDAILYDDLTEAYRRGLAYIDRQLAHHCDTVVEVSIGQITIHKGKLL